MSEIRDPENPFKDIDNVTMQEWLVHPATQKLRKGMYEVKSQLEKRVIDLALTLGNASASFSSEIVANDIRSIGAAMFILNSVCALFEEADQHAK